MQFEAIWMGPEIITLSEASKRKTNTISYYFFWHLKKKNNAIEFMYKQDRLTDRENKLMGRRRGKDKAGCGINRYTLLYIKQTSNRIYCVAQGVIFNIL